MAKLRRESLVVIGMSVILAILALGAAANTGEWRGSLIYIAFAGFIVVVYANWRNVFGK